MLSLRFSPVGMAAALLRSRPLMTSLTLVLYIIGVFSIVLLFQLSSQIEQRLVTNSKSIDLVVGAKGSPLQLVLATLYHLDAPTGNIALSSLEAIKSDPLVRRVVPLSIGDAVRGFRIVGTVPDFFDLYSTKIRLGKVFDAPMQAVLGSEVAEALALNLGDNFIGSHGLVGGSDQHTSTPFTVVAILEPSGSVIDRLCLTSLESVWQLHQHHGDQNFEAASHLHQEISAALVQYKSPIAAASLPRKINSESALQAASPAVEITRLMRLLGLGVRTLQLLSSIILVAAILNALMALTNMLDQRRLDFATMRALGASASWVISTIFIQGILIALAGSVLGIVAAHLALSFASVALAANIGFIPSAFEPGAFELLVLIGAIAVGICSAALPAYRLYKQEVAKTLAQSS